MKSFFADVTLIAFLAFMLCFFVLASGQLSFTVPRGAIVAAFAMLTICAFIASVTCAARRPQRW